MSKNPALAALEAAYAYITQPDVVTVLPNGKHRSVYHHTPRDYNALTAQLREVIADLRLDAAAADISAKVHAARMALAATPAEQARRGQMAVMAEDFASFDCGMTRRALVEAKERWAKEELRAMVGDL